MSAEHITEEKTKPLSSGTCYVMNRSMCGVYYLPLNQIHPTSDLSASSLTSSVRSWVGLLNGRNLEFLTSEPPGHGRSP